MSPLSPLSGHLLSSNTANCQLTNDAVVVCVEVGKLGHFKGNLRQGDEGVVADVQCVELSQVAEFVRQLAHLVVGDVELCNTKVNNRGQNNLLGCSG